VLLLASLCWLTACGGGGNSGGGGGGGTTNPTFTLTAPTQITLQAGGTPQTFTIQVAPSTAEAIQLSFTTPPTGFQLYGNVSYTFPASTLNYDSPFYQLFSGTSVTAGQYSITVTATSGTESHSATIPVTVTPAAPFQLALSPAQLALTPGGVGTIQATISGSNLPSDFSMNLVTVPPGNEFDFPHINQLTNSTYTIQFAAPLDVTAFSSAPIYLLATASIGGANSTSAALLSLSVSQPFAPTAPLTRSNVVFGGDQPVGMVYDKARKLIFAAYGRLNQVVVYSSIGQHVVATIPVPQYEPGNLVPGTIDEAADGSQVYVGGATKITVIDPNSLQVVGTQAVPFLLPESNPFIGLVQPVALADGNVLIENFDHHVYLWNPNSGTITLNDPPEAAAGAFGQIQRSADYETAVMSNPLGLQAIRFSSGSDMWGAYDLNLDGGGAIAISPDGSQVASVCAYGYPPLIAAYDSSWNPIVTPNSRSGCIGANSPSYAIYSLDGRTLYIFAQGSEGITAAYDAQSFAPLGLVAAGDAPEMTVFQPFAIDETRLIYGTGGADYGYGLIVTDALHPAALAPDPNFANGTGTFPYAYPAPNLPFAVGDSPTSLGQTAANTVVGQGFDPDAVYGIYVGPPPGSPGSVQATGVSIVSDSQIGFTSPASNTPGPVNVTLTRSDGWSEVLPQALSYGPSLLGVDPNALAPQGGSTLNVYGYGIASGSASFDGSLVSVSNTGGPLGTTDVYYPVDMAMGETAAGTPGWGDFTFSNGTGSSTLHHAVQFLKSEQTYAMSGQPGPVIYDQAHQLLYVSNASANNVSVFDLATSAFLPPIAVGKGPAAMAIAPDDSVLAVLNVSDKTVSVIDLTQMKVVATWPALTAAEQAVSSNLQVIPAGVSAVEPHRVAVWFTQAPYFHFLDLASGSLSCAGVMGCDTTGTDLNPGFAPVGVASSPDGSKVFLYGGKASLALLDISQNLITQSHAMPGQGPELAVDGDANVYAQGLGSYDSQLSPLNMYGGQPFYFDADGQVEGGTPLSSWEVLNPSGSLMFVIEGQEIYAFDVRHGNVAMRIGLLGQNIDVNSLAIDETGTKLFLSTNSGLEIVDLYEAPLSIGSVTPASGAASTALTIRGSGFENGTTVNFGSTAAAVEFVDALTLHATVPSLSSGPKQVTVTNPDGSSYSFDAAFTVN
jgi:DNA-binding beta-propeller fold protein YncE